MTAPLLQRLLSDFVGDAAMNTTDDKLVLSVVDQSALVTLIARLTDLGIRIEQITATRTGTANSPGPATARWTRDGVHHHLESVSSGQNL